MADRTLRAIITGSSASAVKAFEETALAADAAGSKIGDTIEKGTSRAGSALSSLGGKAAAMGIPFAAVLQGISEKFEQATTNSKKFQTAVAETGKIALLAGAAGLAAFGGEAIKLGNALEDSQATLKAAITAAGQSMTQWQGPINQAQQKLESLGFTNAQFNSALARSVISTQNVGKSLSDMGLAADLARAKHIDLTTATNDLDKALQGNLRPLTQMGISLPIVASSAQKLAAANTAVTDAQANVNAILAKVPDAANAASAAHGIYEAAVEKLDSAQGKLAQQQGASSEILDALTQRLKGQASDAAETFSGKVTVLKAQASDLGSTFGTFLIPKVEALTGFLVDNKGAVELVATAIGVVLAAAIVDFAVTKVQTFTKGVTTMLTAIKGIATAFTETRASVIADQAVIEGGNVGLVTSFRAAAAGAITALAPLAAELAALAAGYAIVKAFGETNATLPGVKATGNFNTAVNEYKNTQVGKEGILSQSDLSNLAQHEIDTYTAKQRQLAVGGGDKGKGVAKPVSDAAMTSAAQYKALIKQIEDQSKQTAAGIAGDSAATKDNAAATSAASASAAAHTKALADQKAAADAAAKSLSTLKDSTNQLVSDALTKAKTSLTEATTAFNNFQSSISQSITSTLSFADAQSASSSNGTDFLTELANQAGTIEDFSTKVKTLVQEGLSQNALQQVLAAGTTAGDSIATSLLNGGAAAITQANSLTQAVQNTADSLGTASADQFYGAGVSQAQSIVKGITEESAKLAPKLKDASAKIAANLKTQVEVDLKIIAAGGKVPKMASGGIVMPSPGGSIVNVAEGGVAEAIIPLNGRSGVATGGDTYNFVINGALDPQGVVNAIKQYMQQNGSLASAGVR